MHGASQPLFHIEKSFLNKRIGKYHMSIHPMHKAFYSESLRFHCQSALNSSHIVSELLKTPQAKSGRMDEIEGADDIILDNLQNLLIHSGAISRYFWPSKTGAEGVHKSRSDELRVMYAIEDESSLKVRTLRNELEHFDENLDKYLRDNP